MPIIGKTEKSGTVGAFDKAGSVDTICILLKDVDPTAEKLYRSDPSKCFLGTTYLVMFVAGSNIPSHSTALPLSTGITYSALSNEQLFQDHLDTFVKSCGLKLTAHGQIVFIVFN